MTTARAALDLLGLGWDCVVYVSLALYVWENLVRPLLSRDARM